MYASLVNHGCHPARYWKQSDAYKVLTGFIQAINNAVKGKLITDQPAPSEVIHAGDLSGHSLVIGGVAACHRRRCWSSELLLLGTGGALEVLLLGPGAWCWYRHHVRLREFLPSG